MNCYRTVICMSVLVSALLIAANGANGRFLQTDPAGYEDDLNLYTYVNNDPINKTDPTGRYDCGTNANVVHCSGPAPAEFERQRKIDLKSANSGVVTGATAFGEPNDSNGVTVSFKPQSQMDEEQNAPAGAHATGFARPGRTSDFKPAIDAEMPNEETGSDLAQTIAHEGNHIADAMKFLKSYDASTGKYDSRQNYTVHDNEVRGYAAGRAVKSYRGMSNSDRSLEDYINKFYPNGSLLEFSPEKFPQ